MERKFGILLPLFSLYGDYGIGNFGSSAYEFVDFLSSAGVGVWQILPLCPIDSSGSPYSSSCSSAFSPLYIDPERLMEKGLLSFEECLEARLPQGRVNYRALRGRTKLLKRAYSRLKTDVPHVDHSVFSALKEHYGGAPHTAWKQDDPAKIKDFSSEEIGFWDFVHFEALEEWQALRTYANSRGVEIVGDMPFYVAHDSFEVWANRDLFALCGDEPAFVAGVPPDYFSQTGQLWGNPVYNWDNPSVCGWWTERILSALALYDRLRLDHFRAFDEYYAIPNGRKDAVVGEWKKGPGKKFFEDKRNLPIIAEDLGTITPSVKELIDFVGYPGMRVLQFSSDDDDNPHAIRNITENCVCYTGTHDNMPLITFVEREREAGKITCDALTAADRIIERGCHSKARLFIVPIFDLMHKGEGYRINTPSTVSEYNWSVRIKRSDLYGLEKKIADLIAQSDRKCNMGAKK